MTSTTKPWVARVDFKAADRLHENADAIDFIFEHLRGHSPVLSRHPHDGIYEITMSVEAPTLHAASTRALELVAVATGGRPVGVEVLREAVFDDRAPHSPAWPTAKV